MWLRLASGLFLLLGATATIAPALLGMRGEEAYHQLLASTARDPSLKIQGEYHRGWFHSSARTRVAGRTNHPPLILDHHIQHLAFSKEGLPLLARIDTSLRGEGATPHAREASAENHFITRIGWQGDAVTRFSLPDQSIPHPSLPLTLRIRDGHGTLHHQPSADQAELRLTAASLALEFSGQIGLAAEGVNGKWRFFPGQRKHEGWFDLRRVTLGSANRPPSHTFHTLSFSTDSEIDQGLMDGGISIAMDEVHFPAYTAGPAEIRINYTGVAIDAIRELSAHSASKPLRPATNPDARAAMLRFLSGGPKVAIEQLYLYTPQGEFDATLLLELASGSPLFDPRAAFTSLRAGGTLRLDEALAHQIGLRLLTGMATPAPPTAAARLDLEVQQRLLQAELAGLVTRHDGRLSSRFELRDGELAVNGIPTPLPLPWNSP